MIHLNILVTDYEKYNDKWEDFQVHALTLPMDSTQLEPYISPRSKLYIIRYEFMGDELNLEIDPHVDLRDLNLLMNYIQTLDYLEIDEFMACMEHWNNCSYNNIIQKFKAKNYTFYSSVTNPEELARYIIDNNIDEITMSPELTNYFSFEDYGRDYADADDGTFTAYGYLAAR